MSIVMEGIATGVMMEVSKELGQKAYNFLSEKLEQVRSDFSQAQEAQVALEGQSLAVSREMQQRSMGLERTHEPQLEVHNEKEATLTL